MDFGVIVHGKKQIVEGVVRRAFGDGRENLFRFVHVFAPNGLTENFAIGSAIEMAGFDGVQNFAFAPAMLLDAIGVSVEDFEDGERLAFFRQFLRHMESRGQRHHRVEPDVIFAAKSAGVGKRGGSYETSQIGPAAELLCEQRQQAIDGRLLHEGNQSFERAELKRIILSGKGGRDAEFSGHFATDRCQEHSSTNVG